MKRFVTMLLLVMALLGITAMLTSCPDKPVPTVDIVRDGVTQYTVVRSEKSGTKSADTLAAAKLRRAIIDATGCNIEIWDDWEKDDNSEKYEILVGRTNRPETAQLPENLARDEFVILFTGKKILIDGGSGIAIDRAVEYFMTTYLGYNKADGTYANKNLAVPEGLNLRTSFEYPASVYIVSGQLKAIGSSDRGGLNHDDIVRLISSLQGIVNRTGKQDGAYLYWDYDGQDQFWLEYLSGEGKMLDGCAQEPLEAWDDFWNVFGDKIKELGIVLWDPNAPSTSNVAATICGVDGYLPVRYSEDPNSLYVWLKDKGVPVKMNLVGKFTGEAGSTIPDTDKPSTGSIKCDPYIWALEKYMDKCNAGMIAYVLDGASSTPGNHIYETYTKAKGVPGPANNQIFSHDYYIYNKCFFIDLTCVADELPCDDKNQPMGTDAKTLDLILSTMEERNNGKMIKFMGFPPWYMKYTTTLNMGSRVPTTLEWEFVEVISKYNCVKEADAAHPAWMTNASLYCSYESTVEYYDNNKSDESEMFDEKVRYFTIYMGDYDSSAWLKKYVPAYFKDKMRDKYPLMWGFNPNLSDRVPMIFDYVYENLGNDFIVTGDSGAGYVIPSALPELDTWAAFNKPYMERFDLDIVGFIINGNNKMTMEIFKAYAKIAPVGSFHNDSSQKLVIYDDETVYMHLMNGINPEDLPGMVEAGKPTVFDKMYEYASNTGNNFSAYRTVVKTPGDVVRCIEGFIEYANAKNDGYTYVYVDPYTLFDLVLQSGQGTHVYPQ